MLLLVGTITVHAGEVFCGPVGVRNGKFYVAETELPACQGSAAMAMAAFSVTQHFGMPDPVALFGGDSGHGDGTRAVYRAFEETLTSQVLARNKRVEQGVDEPIVIVFHYLLPVMSLMKHAFETIQRIAPEALLVADAGGMYAARAAGLGGKFELMTPDVGEIGFLAEEGATHPASVADYLFGTENFDVKQLVEKAYALNTAARVLIVKGSTDYVASRDSAPHHLVATLSEPNIPELEAIGGTGDTITGLSGAFMSCGLGTVEAARKALKLNREAGAKLHAQVYTSVSKIIAEFGSIMHP